MLNGSRRNELSILRAFDTDWKVFLSGNFMLLLGTHFSWNLRLESDSVYTRRAKPAALKGEDLLITQK